ncbi:MAG TPA: cytochrome c maturation protein CcmE, partial [Acidimicrobiales bacterium]
LGTDRFRLQGKVVDDSVEETDDGVAFQVTFNGVTVDVVHQGDPPELFQPGIPVVLEGHWDGDVYASDRILVKHSSEYEAENEDRLREADEGQSSP